MGNGTQNIMYGPVGFREWKKGGIHFCGNDNLNPYSTENMNKIHPKYQRIPSNHTSYFILQVLDSSLKQKTKNTPCGRVHRTI